MVILTSLHVALLTRVLLAHILLQFFLRPATWARDMEEKKGKSKYLYFYSLSAGILIYLVSSQWHSVWIVLYVGVLYGIVEWVRVRVAARNSLHTFLWTHLIYLLALVLLALLLIEKTDSLVWLSNIYSSPKAMVLLTGYVICTLPLSFLIDLATAKWQRELTSPQEPSPRTDSLTNAGKWIGIIERLMVLTFVLLQKYEAIGFLITAKSLLRFRQGATESKQSEYVLLGTLLSYSSSIAIGMLMAGILKLL